MAGSGGQVARLLLSSIATVFAILSVVRCTNDIVGCGGFVQSEVPIQFEKVGVKLYTKAGALKIKTECAPNNGYFLVAVYDKGDYTVKIDPPEGWNFEPTEIDLHIDGKTDPCVKGVDINFKFTGYTVGGMVASKGRDQGPAGVALTLKRLNSDETAVASTTEEGGKFQFPGVFPGKYTIHGSHPLWRIENANIELEVTNDNIELQSQMVVSGYDVKGHVLSGDQPIKGVVFILLTPKSKSGSAAGCADLSNDMLSKLSKSTLEQNIPVCSVTSSEDGFFTFPSVASGDYILVPHYSSGHIVFDVVPPLISFSVNYKSVILKTPFQVHGFSVSGKVVNSDGKGLANVGLRLVGETVSEGTTAQDGTYVVENVTIGSYKVKASAQHIFFEEQTVYITPNTPHLPDIKASMYSVCGSITVTSLPAGSLPLSQRKVMMLPVGSQNSAMSTQNVNSNGEFCFKVPPGSYKVEALVGPGEQKAGFILKPKEHVVAVSTEPILNVHFKQFLANVAGRLSCVGDCDNATVSMTKVQSNEKVMASMTYSNKEALFSFSNILPGKYKLSPVREKWCWDPRGMEIEVIDGDISDMHLSHVGYILKCVPSHDIKLNFTVEGVNETVGSFNLSKGANKFCLKEAGVYHLVPLSCYKFDQNVYIYDTSQPTTLTLSVVGYKVTIEVRVAKELQHLSLLVTSKATGVEEVLKPDLVVSQTTHTKSNNGSVAQHSTDSGKQAVYSATFWGKLSDELDISAQSKEVLFNPPSVTVLVADGCPAAHVQMEGKEGIFVAGRVIPPISDVLITVVTIPSETHKTSATYTALTKSDGSYSIGPLHDDIKVDVTALKSGYIIKGDGDSQVNFVAEKLSEIKVQIIDAFGNPMSGVLLSLSGGQFRSNSLTPENGELSFIDLAPGSYYLRPMQKEFSFEPSAQLVDVKEGAVSTLQIRGVRVAFSCHGLVTTLSREPERQVTVEAIGLDDCSEYQEEGITDNDGRYRLRGLHPKCHYAIRLQTGEGAVSHISRTAPGNRTIQIIDEDLVNIHFIAFHKPKSFELTVYIDTEQANLNQLKLLLFQEDNTDSPVHTVTPTVLNHIFFPPLPLTKATYIIRLDTTLSHKTHDIKSSSVTFSMEGLYKKHIVMKFSASKKGLDPEPTQSVIALPFAVALVLVAYNYDTAVPFLINLYNRIRGRLDNNGEQSDSGEDEGKTRKKRR